MSGPPLTRRLPAQAAGSFATGSSLPQALIQRRQRLTYYRASTEQTGHPVVVSTAACGGRLGGGPAHDGGFHLPRLRLGIDRRYAITPQPVKLIASAQKRRVPSSVRVCANLPAPRSPAPSVSVFVLKTDSNFPLGPRRGIDPVGETSNVPDTPLGSRRLPRTRTFWRSSGSLRKRCELAGCGCGLTV